MDPERSSTAFRRVAPNDSRSARTFTGVQGFDFPDYDYSGRLDWNLTAIANADRPVPVDPPAVEMQRTSFIGEDAVLQDNKQQNLGTTWTHVLGSMPSSARSVTVSGSRSTNVDIDAGQRHADRAVHGHAGIRHHHRQRRQLPDQPRSDRPPVRLQPDGPAVQDPFASRPAPTSAGRRSTTWRTTSRAASGPSRPPAAARPTRLRTPPSSMAASSTTRRDTARSSSRTG